MTQRLQMVFEEIRSDARLRPHHGPVRQGKKDFVFATMRIEFDDAENPTYGALVQRRTSPTTPRIGSWP